VEGESIGTISRRWKGNPRALAELDRLRARWRAGRHQSPAEVKVAVLDGPVLLVKPKGRLPAVVRPGLVELPVYGRGSEVLFRAEFEVVIDEERQRVRRGRQTFTALPDGPEVTAKAIQRDAQLGAAWRRAVEALTVTDHPKAHAALATTETRRVEVDGDAERELVARLVLAAEQRGRRVTADELARALSKRRGEPVTARVARGRKQQARAAGLLPKAESTRPQV
jgi:hypothetical protein